jgi:hypothetical protein
MFERAERKEQRTKKDVKKSHFESLQINVLVSVAFL